MCAILLLAICLPVSAHPGGTDGAGGHINSANGEYHYHHGHAAHQHYDMDGDGKKDCPYNYNDASKKNNSSGSSSESGEYISPTIDPEIMEDLEKANDEMRALMESIAESDKESDESRKEVEKITNSTYYQMQKARSSTKKDVKKKDNSELDGVVIGIIGCIVFLPLIGAVTSKILYWILAAEFYVEEFLRNLSNKKR